MARTFNGSTMYLERTSTPITTTPLTMSSWFRCTTLTANNCIMSVAHSGTDTNGFYLEASGNNVNDPLSAYTASGSTFNAATINNYPNGTWAHALGVWTSATQRDIYMNGVLGTTNASSTTPASTPDRIGIGVLDRLTRTSFFTGDLGPQAIWNAALNASEALALAQGVSPLHIRPANLVLYVPIRGDSPEVDMLNNTGFTLTAAPATTTNVPPISQLGNNYQFVIAGDGMSVTGNIR